MRTRLRRGLIAFAAISIVSLLLVIGYIAWPTQDLQPLPAPLKSAAGDIPVGNYTADFGKLKSSFTPQRFRSFCGPASLATVLRAYGRDADQTDILPSAAMALGVFFSGTSLSQLQDMATRAGMTADRVHAESITLEEFRTRLKVNLSTAEDYVLINYDRRVLRQAGAGHISPIAAYDETTDQFLVMDQASYRYPFTWVPAPLLFAAMHTKAAEGWRGVLFLSQPIRQEKS